MRIERLLLDNHIQNKDRTLPDLRSKSHILIQFHHLMQIKFENQHLYHYRRHQNQHPQIYQLVQLFQKPTVTSKKKNNLI